MRYASTCGVCPSLLQCGQRGHSGGPDRPRPCCWSGINHRSRSKAAHPGREPSDGTISSRLDRELQEVVNQDWTDARGVSFAIDPPRSGWHLEWQEHIARRTLILSTPTVCHPLHKCSLPQSTLSFLHAQKILYTHPDGPQGRARKQHRANGTQRVAGWVIQCAISATWVTPRNADAKTCNDDTTS